MKIKNGKTIFQGKEDIMNLFFSYLCLHETTQYL